MNTAETCSSSSGSTAFPVGLVDRSKVVKGAPVSAADELRDDAMPEPTDEQGRFTTAGSSASANSSGYAAPSPGRRRSMSLASGQPTLETVVVKAKRAASSLWILLHAQNCSVMAGKCPHAGCLEAKMMHLHLKTCPAAAVSKGPCPTHYHGCDQARKLLAHYRQCKSARLTSRHTGGGSLAASRRSGSFDLQPAAHCLICSFVARQARTLLVGGTGSPPGGGASSSIGSLASTSWNSRKHPPPSKGSHTVSFVVDVVADAVSALARDDAPPAKTITSPASAKTGSPPGNGILKLAPPPVQVLLPPPPPPPPPPSPYDQAATGPSGQEQANRAGSDDDADEDVVMSTVDNDSTRPQLSETVASTKAVLVPDSKTPTSSPPDPTFLSEPDAASLLCSLACNLQLPLKVLPESYSMMHPQQRRDRAVSSADSLVSSTVPAYHHPLSIRRDPLTLDAPPQPLGLVRRRSVSLGSAPQSYGPRATAAASLRVDDTIYEEGSQTSGDSIEPLDFPNF